MEKTLKTYSLYTLIGLVSASIMTVLSHAHIGYAAPYIFIASLAFIFALAYDERHSKRLVISSVVTAFIITFPFLSMNFNGDINGHGILARYMEFIFFSLPSFAFMLHCFHYAYHKTGDYRLDYRYLFEAVWNTIPMLFVAGLFANITNALIIFASLGFKTLNNDFIEHYYTHNMDVLFILNSVFFFVGLSIAKIHDKITLNLRFVFLRMLNFLLPLLVLTTFTYAIMFCLYHGGNVFTTSLLTGTPILASLTVLGIIFFNAFYQDGDTDTKLHMVFSITLKIYRVLLFVLAIYSVLQILGAYSALMPTNIELYLIILVLFPFIYALSAFFNTHLEKALITNGNMLIAIVYLIVLLVIYHPFHTYEPPFVFKGETFIKLTTPQKTTIKIKAEPQKKAKEKSN